MWNFIGMKLIIFDLDGTLNETASYALLAYHQTFLELGCDHFSDEQIISRFGAKVEEDVQFFLGTQEEAIIKQYVSTLAKYWYPSLNANGRVFEGAIPCLKQLIQEGYTLAICSNASHDEIIETLRILKILPYINYIQGLDEFLSKAESLGNLLKTVSCTDVCMVGDRFYDCDAAKQNHIPFIACRYGYGKEEVQHVTYGIDALSELPTLVHTLFDNEANS